MRLVGKVALVTGASRGIGKATALLFGEEGAKVVVNYSKDRTAAEATAAEIEKLGSEALVIKCDVSDEQQVEVMVENAIRRFGRLDILVNNAGISLRRADD